jgi:hypothetical protein|nr:MAG TPA: N terminal extension of bacteriophage endosialidase [Caudoviricetes sp.]
MYKIPYRMIEIVTDSGEVLSLEDILKSLSNVPMSLYTGNNDFTKEKIEDVINYLKTHGGGQFTIPENPPYHKLTVDVHRNKFQDYAVHFLYYDYRYPIGTEKRPYTGENWQAGDIIYNLDILNSDDKCTLWFCKESGNDTSAGKWSQQSIWQLSSSEIDGLVVSHVGSSIGPLVKKEVGEQGPAMMSSEVTKQLDAKVPTKVEAEVTKQLATTVPTRVSSIVETNLPNEVTKRVDSVITPIINARLGATLSDASVTKLINDKVDTKVKSITDTAQQTVNTKITEATSTLNNTVNNYIDEAKRKLGAITTVTEKDVDDKIKESSKAINTKIDNIVTTKLANLRTGHSDIVATEEYKMGADGVVDDTAKFEQCVNDARGKVLIISPGVYKLTKNIFIGECKDVIVLGSFNTKVPFIPNDDMFVTAPSNIEYISTVALDTNKVNQCQGFAYNSTNNEFVLATINSDNTNQILYILDGDNISSVKRKVEFSDIEKLGHCNTMTYNKDTSTLYVCNGDTNSNPLKMAKLSNTYSLTGVHTDSSNVKKYNFAYDPITKCYCSIMPGNRTSSLRHVYILDTNFTVIKEFDVDFLIKDFNNNGAMFYDGNIMCASINSILQFDVFGNTKTIIEIDSSYEIEDFDIKNGYIYFSVLEGHKVHIFRGISNKFNSVHINNMKVNRLLLPNNSPLSGLTADGKTLSLVKVGSSGSSEIGDKTATTVIVGKEVKTWDGGNASYTLLSTKHYGEAIYSKKQVDDSFVKKSELARTNITTRPDYVGQIAVADGKTYIAVSTLNAVDGWKEFASGPAGAVDRVRFNNGAELWIDD